MPKQTISRCPGAAVLGYAGTVASIGAAGTLRGYWRLGEVAAPFADSSGWVGGPTNLTLSGAGAAPTTHVAGALTGGQDDGAVQLNGGGGTGQYLHNASGALNTGINSAWTIAAWVRPAASGASWIAGVYNNLANSGGGDAGWNMTLRWSGGSVVAGLRRAIAGAYIAIGVGVPVAAWTFLVGTYDASTLRLYSNGVLVSSFADSRADTFNPYSNADLGVVFSDPVFTPGRVSGDLDEVALWGTVLSLADIQTLYAAATS